MPEQNYSNHRRYVPLFHIVLFAMIVLSIVGSIINFVKSVGTPQLYAASLLVVAFFCLLLLFVFSRSFALKAQDRAIRAEENFRHFLLTGKALDPRLTIRQIIGLRFAADDEFLGLAQRAATEELSEDQIKRAIKNWRADYYRV